MGALLAGSVILFILCAKRDQRKRGKTSSASMCSRSWPYATPGR
jgi:hypothetical protein